jgi:hypothetical protein
MSREFVSGVGSDSRDFFPGFLGLRLGRFLRFVGVMSNVADIMVLCNAAEKVIWTTKDVGAKTGG